MGLRRDRSQVFGRVATVNVAFDPNLVDSKYESNPVFSIFGALDLTFIVKIILSLFAILFTYDAIVGEKEKGTLKLTLSNNVPRDRLILGKVIGGFISLLIQAISANGMARDGPLGLQSRSAPLSGVRRSTNRPRASAGRHQVRRLHPTRGPGQGQSGVQRERNGHRPGPDHASGPGGDRLQPRRYDDRGGRLRQGPHLLRVTAYQAFSTWSSQTSSSGFSRR